MNKHQAMKALVVISAALFQVQACSAAGDGLAQQTAGHQEKERELVRAMAAEDWGAAYNIAVSIDEKDLAGNAITRVEVASAMLNAGHPEAALRQYEIAYLQTYRTGRYAETRTESSATTSWDIDGLAMIESLRGIAVSSHLLGRHQDACKRLLELSSLLKYDWAAFYWRAQSELAGHPCVKDDSADDLLREAATLLQHPNFGPRLLSFRLEPSGR